MDKIIVKFTGKKNRMMAVVTSKQRLQSRDTRGTKSQESRVMR